MWNSYCGQMFGWGGGIYMIIFWLAAILLFIGLVKYFIKNGNTPSVNKAVDILKERYAKGEISKQEFEDKLKDVKD